MPEPLWGLSAYRLLKPSQWQRIRRDALDAAAGACSVCGVVRDKGMVGDEEWTYEDGVALLADIRIVCPDCNAVTHIGHTSVAGYGDVALAHMARVNGGSIAEAARLLALEAEEWRKRSGVTWTVAVAPDLVERYPELSVLVGRTSVPGDRGERPPVSVEPEYGANGGDVASLVARCQELTANDLARLQAALEADFLGSTDKARVAAFRLAERAGRKAEWDAALHAVESAVEKAVRRTRMGGETSGAVFAVPAWAALALVVRDLITSDQYRTLTRPWLDAGFALA